MSLAELIDTDVAVRPDEAVTIVREVCRQHAVGTLRGIPNATVIRLTPDGRLVVEGPVSRDQAPVLAAAALLSDLLPGFQAPGGFKVPGGLRLVLARATHAIDLPPFADLDEFSASLERFAAEDLATTVRRLFAEWTSHEAPVGAPIPSPSGEITISDVRRARRATGLTLEDVSRACGIPAWKLRELEWGYLRNWTADEDGREALRRYAQAAGVDEDLVVSVAWPLVESVAVDTVVVEAAAEPEAAWALVPAVPRDAPVAMARTVRAPRAFFAGQRWLLALAAAVVLVIAAVAIGWERSAPLVAAGEPRIELSDETPVPTAGSEPVIPLVKDERPAAAAKFTATRPRPARAKARPSQPPAHKSFFKRELFRIVIK